MPPEMTLSLQSPRRPVGKCPSEVADHPQYEVLRELGRGGMGIVYLVRNKLLDRLEVLKVVSAGWTATSGAIERFMREIQTAARLRHENVVGAYNAIQVGGLLGFAMEYVDGQDLNRFVHAQGPLRPEQAAEYIRQAALGLQHAFEKGTVHRDIKPENLILARGEGREVVKILDFGIARATHEKEFDPRLTEEGFLVGTPAYIAPERILDSATADIRSDIYSLGCTAFFLLTGRPPFQAANAFKLLEAHQSAEPARLDHLRPDVPKRLADVIARMLAKEPAQRYQQPVEVAEAIARALDGNAPTDRTQALTSSGEPTRDASAGFENVVGRRREGKARGKRRHPWHYVGTAVLVAGLVLGTVVLLSGARNTAEPWQPEVDPPLPAAAQPVGLPPSVVHPPVVHPPVVHPPVVHPPVVPPAVVHPVGVLVLDDCDSRYTGKEAQKDSLTLFRADGGRAFRLSDFSVAQSVGATHRIAVDPARKAIWTVEDVGRRVRRLDFDGNVTRTIDHPSGSALAVDPATGNVWVVSSSEGSGATHVYDPEGKLVSRHAVSGLDIAYDSVTKSFWIAHHSLTQIDAATGEEKFSAGVAGFCIASIDADSKQGGVWVAVRGASVDPQGNRLLRFDSSGEQRVRIDLGERNPFSASVDSQGGVWVAYLNGGIEHFSAAGASQGAADLSALAVLASDDGNAWVATPTDLRKVSVDGAALLRRSHAGKSGQAWLASFGPG